MNLSPLTDQGFSIPLIDTIITSSNQSRYHPIPTLWEHYLVLLGRMTPFLTIFRYGYFPMVL